MAELGLGLTVVVFVAAAVFAAVVAVAPHRSGEMVAVPLGWQLKAKEHSGATMSGLTRLVVL